MICELGWKGIPQSSPQGTGMEARVHRCGFPANVVLSTCPHCAEEGGDAWRGMCCQDPHVGLDLGPAQEFRRLGPLIFPFSCAHLPLQGPLGAG